MKNYLRTNDWYCQTQKFKFDMLTKIQTFLIFYIHTFFCLLQPLVEHSTNSVYYSRPLMLKPRTTLIRMYEQLILAGTSMIFTRWPRSFWRELRISWHLSQNLMRNRKLFIVQKYLITAFVKYEIHTSVIKILILIRK